MLQLLKRLLPSTRAAARGDWDTAGGGKISSVPVKDILQAVAVSFKEPFKDGRWSQAQFVGLHPGRLGGPIIPRGLTVHTTDTYPGGFNAIVRSWTTTPGKGNAAQWLFGRTPSDGIVQFVSIFRNGNHAGGPNHGSVVMPGAGGVHPNLLYVGVELDNAGRLKGKGGKFIHPDTGREIHPDDVYIDDKGQPWHKVTDYQMQMLKALWRDLYPTLKPFPSGTKITIDASYASQGSEWAKPRYINLVGHASLNPIQKTDPGPQVMAWMKS